MRAAEIVRRHTGSRYTAAVLRVQIRGRLAYEEAFGRLADDPREPSTVVRTPFDLASLTKVFVATSALEAVLDGALALDAPPADRFAPWRATDHAPITARMLLAHTAGFASGADYRTLFAENVERFALARSLIANPGSRVVYSDLGFIALGALLQRVRGASLASVVASTTARSGCEDTAFRTRNDDPWRIPVTECDAWRGRVRGTVHDEKAALMGGVSGHAGLFGTAHDVGALAERYLGAVCGRTSDAAWSALACEAIVEHGADPVLRRGLGWALKTSDDNSCGAAMDRATFGHTGFTGTCVWADPTRDLSIVLLTNAVAFGRHDLRDVRAAVCDAVVKEIA